MQQAHIDAAMTAGEAMAAELRDLAGGADEAGHPEEAARWLSLADEFDAARVRLDEPERFGGDDA